LKCLERRIIEGDSPVDETCQAFCIDHPSEETDSGALLPEAARAGVLYSPGRLYFVNGGARHLRLSFGNVPTDQVEEGARRLGAVLRRELARETTPPRRARGMAMPPV
jgi:DNA-binding transcriptional MocR family regulator